MTGIYNITLVVWKPSLKMWCAGLKYREICQKIALSPSAQYGRNFRLLPQYIVNMVYLEYTHPHCSQHQINLSPPNLHHIQTAMVSPQEQTNGTETGFAEVCYAWCKIFVYISQYIKVLGNTQFKMEGVHSARTMSVVQMCVSFLQCMLCYICLCMCVFNMKSPLGLGYLSVFLIASYRHIQN